MALPPLDANGNTSPGLPPKQYSWDFEKRLIRAVVLGTTGGTTTFRNDPFGGRIQKSGKERESESGLDDFHARYFTSSMGRWMMPRYHGRTCGGPSALNFTDSRAVLKTD
jgi:hypothetical protein